MAERDPASVFVQASSSDSGCPMRGQPGGPPAAVPASGGCPVDHGGGAVSPQNYMPAAQELQGAAAPPDDPAAAKLGTGRVKSSIPMGASTLPQHQTQGSNTWTYPSEKMFYNAMRRKGWQPDAGDMKSVVMIHNVVNERAWNEVLEWEKLHESTCGDPKLVKFQGRPKDYSPKARMLNFLGYKLPFDRHDWIVDRCGTEVRYVIDFYNAKPSAGAPVGMHLDVRPALDSPGSLLDRLWVQMQWVGSGKWMS